MTLADWMILAAALIPHITSGFAKSRARRQFNNADPRNLEGFEPAAMRAYNAHLNGFEIFPLFAVAIIFAEFRGAHQGVIDALALTFIGLRLLYTVAYVGNKAALRSGLFTLGFLVAIAIFLLPFFS